MHHLLCHPANSRMLAPAGPGACYLWDDGSIGNPRTVTPLQSAQYRVTVLDAQLRPAIWRYNVEVVRIQTELLAALAPGDFCGAGPVTLQVEGALPHYTYRWSTGDTTAGIQIPLSGMAPAYRVTVTDARQDGAGNTVACAQVLELRAAEVLAAVEEQQCGLLFDRLLGLGLEPSIVKINDTINAVSLRSNPSLNCNIFSNTNFTIEWNEELVDPQSLICAEMASFGENNRGFIYSSKNICTEEDFIALKTLFDEKTIIYYFINCCNANGYNYLMKYNPYLDNKNIIVTQRLKNDGTAYAGYLEFIKSEQGVNFLKLFGYGGKYSDFPVYFDNFPDSEKDDIADNGLAEAIAVNRSSNKEILLKPKEDIERYPAQLKGFRSSLKEGEYLKFRVRVDGYGDNANDKRAIANTGLRFLHESQHLAIMANDYKTKSKLIYGAYNQHVIMKDSRWPYFNERFNFYKQRRPDFTDKQIREIVNAFPLEGSTW